MISRALMFSPQSPVVLLTGKFMMNDCSLSLTKKKFDSNTNLAFYRVQAHESISNEELEVV
jgi:hypothetical protein